MIARILPPEEWGRLSHTGVPFLPGLNPDDIDIVSVEDEGKLVAAMTVFKITHFEGVWVSPEKRGLGATRAMLRLAAGLAKARGNSWVVAGAADDRMRHILGRMGAHKLQMDPYLLSLGG